MDTFKTKINIKESMFGLFPFILLENENFKVTTLLYESGIQGLKIDNGLCNMVVLPYMGHQIWFTEYENKKLFQKSIFNYPENTTKFGDNYGAFLIHCGLTNINAPGEGENYPLHGELPFAKYKENYIELGTDDNGDYLIVGGTFEYKNSQDYFYQYCPKLKMYSNSMVLHMKIDIHNKRSNNLDYLYMCHMNWLGVDGSKIVCSAYEENYQIQEIDNSPMNDRAKKLNSYLKEVHKCPSKLNKLDYKTQVYNPELCASIKYEKDNTGWSHALQILPTGDSTYIGFNSKKLPYGLRWYCFTNDENGLGLCLPTTGTYHSSSYQYENGYFNTIKGNSNDIIEFKFGYLNKDETEKMNAHIKAILERSE